MAQETINVGTTANDGTGDGLRDAFVKVNDNFDEVYSNISTKAPKGDITSAGLTTTGPALVGRTDGTSGAVQALDQAEVKTILSLDQVDNTADTDKPVSTATATELAGKEPTITAGDTTQYWRGDKSWATLDKTAVGLDAVENTADLDKPTSNATQDKLDAKMDSDAAIPATQLTLTASSVFLGRNTAGAGNAEELSFTTARAILAISNVNNTSDDAKPVSTATQAQLDTKMDKTATNIQTNQISGLDTQLANKLNVGFDLSVGSNYAGLLPVTNLAKGSDNQFLSVVDGVVTWVAAPSGSSAVTSVAGKVGDVILTKSDVDLANVDNTSDEDKPTSTETQGKLDAKANKVTSATADHLASLTADGDIKDSGKALADLALVSDIPVIPHSVKLIKGDAFADDQDSFYDMATDAWTINVANCYIVALTAPTVDTTMNLLNNGTQIGTITFLASSTTGTLDIPQEADLAVARGNTLEVAPPSDWNTTDLAKISIILHN